MRIDEPNGESQDANGNAAPDFVRRLVEDAYRVVEDNLRSGQEFAKQIAGQLPYPPFGADGWGATPFAAPLSLWLNAMASAFSPAWARGWQGPFESGTAHDGSGYVPDPTPPEEDVGLHPQSNPRYRTANGAAGGRSANGRGAPERRLVIEDVERHGFGRLEGVVHQNGTVRRVRLEFLD